MRLIIAEGVLFVVLVTTGAALLCFVVVQSTPIGFRLCLGALTMMCADHDQENPWLAGA